MHKALHLKDGMNQENKEEEEDSPTLRTKWMKLIRNSKNIQKRAKKTDYCSQ